MLKLLIFNLIYIFYTHNIMMKSYKYKIKSLFVDIHNKKIKTIKIHYPLLLNLTINYIAVS